MFSEQFEYHKIPEWYSEYLDYNFFKEYLKLFRTNVRDGDLTKLRGLYTLTKKRLPIQMDIFGGAELSKDDSSEVSNSNSGTNNQFSPCYLPKIDGPKLSVNQ